MRAFLFTLFFLLGVTLVAIAQPTLAKVDELKVIATPEGITPHPGVIGAEPELALKDIDPLKIIVDVDSIDALVIGTVAHCILSLEVLEAVVVLKEPS